MVFNIFLLRKTVPGLLQPSIQSVNSKTVNIYVLFVILTAPKPLKITRAP